MKEKSCCFTGHRKIPSNQYEQIKAKLTFEIKKCIKNEITTFYAGGAMGFDTIAADAVLELKKKYNEIKLILILPCKNQTQYWQIADIQKYEEIKKIVISIYIYPKNTIMVVCRKETDGLLTTAVFVFVI